MTNGLVCFLASLRATPLLPGLPSLPGPGSIRPWALNHKATFSPEKSHSKLGQRAADMTPLRNQEQTAVASAKTERLVLD